MTENRKDAQSIDLAALRARLAEARGPEYWRSLEELADTEEFQAFLRAEFPHPAPDLTDAVSRRHFLKLMGASLALAGVTACTRQPTEHIVPYVRALEEIVPGKPLFFATAMPMAGAAIGVLVESHMGRPTKVEGNPDHPASLGATDVFAQASVLTLYDPDRSQVVTYLGSVSTWDEFLQALGTALEGQRVVKGAGLRLLTETVTSPTLARQIEAILDLFPEAKWHQYEPIHRDHVKAGARLAFGEVVETRYRFDRADVILSLDGDFLTRLPGSVAYARQFTSRRRTGSATETMNRLYVVESVPTLTGSMADHRLALRASQIEALARAVARELGLVEDELAEFLIPHKAWIEALARDLKRHRGASLIIAGDEQPPAVHALVHAMNHALGNVGKTVVYTEPIEARPIEQMESLQELVADMDAGRVDALIILGGNPVYTAPADLDFAERLSKVKFRVHLGLYNDETAELCHWHIPETHYLESWSDVRAYDGTVSIVQPLIAPLYGGKSAHELLSALLGKPGQSSYAIVRETWRAEYERGRWPQYKNFEHFWQIALNRGVIEGTTLTPKSVSLKMPPGGWASPSEPGTAGGARQAGTQRTLEINFRPDPTIWDGRFANNGWLQELPKPLTKLTWDNAALVSPALAERLGLKNGDLVRLEYRDRLVRAPIWVLPGHPDDSVTVHLGYGRRRAGRLGTGIGFNAYVLRSSDASWFAPGVTISKTGDRYELVSTQHHHSMEGRHLVRVGTVEEYRKNPRFAQEMGENPAPDMTLYPGYTYQGYAWGMAIDLNACIGCNACVIACQAENNIPVVGKKEVGVGREMHWIRVDRYYRGGLDNPETYHQPVPCMHCENAPCEVVCPVGATVHDKEGLNVMVYNRCVGTRYCSNNCPYKVRRFNFKLYADWTTESFKAQRNPDVTVRSRGVMEKCTYCLQRINTVRIEAEKQNRPIRDGEILTACQQACPTEAIVFGNINDPDSRVARLKAEPLNYGILTELNTRPRTTYLAKLRNPNPEIEHE